MHIFCFLPKGVDAEVVAAELRRELAVFHYLAGRHDHTPNLHEHESVVDVKDVVVKKFLAFSACFCGFGCGLVVVWLWFVVFLGVFFLRDFVFWLLNV